MNVFTNTAVSLDGRIATAHFDHVAIGTPWDRRYMSVLRARADAVIVGGQTFRNWPLPLVADLKAIAELQAAGFPDATVPVPSQPPFNVVLSRELNLPTTGKFFDNPAIRPLFFTPSLEGKVPGEVVRGPVSPQVVLANLAARGVENVLIEAGGSLIFEFLEAGVVDEVFVTVCPVILGGKGAPTLADGVGFGADSMKRLKLRSHIVWGDELYLRYTVVKS